MQKSQVTVEWIATEDLLPLIHLAFDGDADLLKWHISPGTVEHMATDTFKNICESAVSCPSDSYRVLLNRDGVVRPIGFSVTTMAPYLYLSSFGINVAYRTREILDQWLRQVNDLFGGRYSVVLWRKNKRAISFFHRNGFWNTRAKDKYIELWQ